MKERFTHLKNKAQEIASDPVSQQRALDAATEVGGAVFGHVRDEFIKERKDGSRKVRKLKVVKAVRRPFHTVRTVGLGAGRAGYEASKSVARDTATDAVKERFGGTRGVNVHTASHAENIPVHTRTAEDAAPWADEDLPPPLYGNVDDAPWNEPVAGRKNPADDVSPPWHDDNLPPAA